MKLTRLVALVFFVLFLFSCLTVNKSVRYLSPAEISISKDIKNIAILTTGKKFQNLMYSILMNIFGKEEVIQRFNLIDKENINTILKEQNLYNRDEFDDATAVELGQLSGAQAIIIASIKEPNESTSSSTVVISRRYVDGYKIINGTKINNYKYVDENVSSTIKTYTFVIDIRLINISTGNIIHTESKSYKESYEVYKDDKPNNFSRVAKKTGVIVQSFPSFEEIINKNGESFSKYFAKKIAPYYLNAKISFETISGDKINERFIKFVKSDLYDEALEVMNDSMTVVDSIEKLPIKAKHYYNIASIYELKEDFETSKAYYEKSVKFDPTKLHLNALKSIKERIEKRDKLNKQLETDAKTTEW